MKSMKLYMVLVVLIMVTLGAAAFLTNMFMNISVPDASDSHGSRTSAGKLLPDEPMASSETTIKLEEGKKQDKHIAQNLVQPNSSLSGFTPPPASNKSGIGKISTIMGTAFLSKPNTKSKKLAEKERIDLNDRIRTDPGSRLEITFDDGTIISLGENSEIIIDEFLYTPDSPKDNAFSMRFVKGVCRTVTGMITNLNPDRYKVKSRMATIGIRGCDVIMQAANLSENIYIIDLGGQKLVKIDTTTNGSPLRDPVTNNDMPIDKSIQKVIDIDKPRQMVALSKGNEPDQRSISIAETRDLVALSSYLSPTAYDTVQEPDGILFQVQPSKEGNL